VSIGALLGVMDEVELVGPCIEHLRRIGIDHIVACDYGSSDGTLDVLERERRAGDLVIHRVVTTTVPDYERWSIQQLPLVRQMLTDWIVFLDADEFWIPESGSLCDEQYLTGFDLLVVERFNVPVTTRDEPRRVDAASFANHDDLLLFTRRTPDFRAFVEANPDVPFISVMPGPKVMARRSVITGIQPGSHDVCVAADTPVRRGSRPGLLIAHVAFSSASRFKRKIENIRAELTTNAECYHGALAWHWKRWIAMADEGTIDQEFARQVSAPDVLQKLRREAVVRSANEVFAEQWRHHPDAPLA
jgi:hypothetical protein